MAIDFDSLVLSACQNVYGETITIVPLKSQPLAANYDLRGIWMSRHIEVTLEDGTVMSTMSISIGIRESEFVAGGHVIPTKDDQVIRKGLLYTVFDIAPDGYGDRKLVLRKAV